MKLRVCMLGASVLCVVVGTAAAKNHKYPWCGSISEHQGSVTDGDTFRFNSDADDLADEKGHNALYNVALASCGQTSSNSDAFDKQLTAARARWSKRLELTEADWKDVAMYTTLEQYVRQGDKIERIKLHKRTYESLTPLEQFSAVQHGTHAADDTLVGSGRWVADILGAHLSATGRLAFLKDCINETGAVEMASCAPDVAAFDAHKVFEEMHADTSANGGARVEIRLFADRMRREIPVFQERVAALKKSDPAYAKLFELATQTAKQWDAMYAAHDPNVDLALEMDDAWVTNSRKAYEGCTARTREAWLKAVSEIPAKRFAKMHDAADGTQRFADEGLPAVLQTADGYLAGFAMLMCAHDSSDDTLRGLGDAIAGLSQRWTGNRGPRGAIVSAVTAADLKFDDRDVTLEQPEEYREWMRPPPPEHRGGGGLGVIAKVAPKAGKLHVEFVMVAGSEEACAEGSFSHRIEAIRDDGTVQYHHDCKRWKMVKTQKGSSPTDIDASFAGKLKAGMKVSIAGGVVNAAWATPKSATPVIVFGAPVK